MRISKLIGQLNELKAKHGDLIVTTTDYDLGATLQPRGNMLFGIGNHRTQSIRTPRNTPFEIEGLEQDSYRVGKVVPIKSEFHLPAPGKAKPFYPIKTDDSLSWGYPGEK